MPDSLYPSSARRVSGTPTRLTPEIHDAFQTFSRRVFTNGALTTKTKQLIAVAVAHVTQCPYCIRGHTKAAMGEGATREELMESIWWQPKCARAPPMHTRSLRSTKWRRLLRRVLLAGLSQPILRVDETSARAHVSKMTCKVAFHLRLPPQGTNAAGF
jgi:AhpD family alkylhydroperoxidase